MKRSSNSKRKQPGFVLLVTMLALLVVVSLLATLLDGTRQRHAHLRLRRQVRQAELLVAAGRDLALQRLATDADYSGETWEPSVLEDDTARVRLRITDTAGTSSDRLEVAVVLLTDGTEAVRRSGVFTMPRQESPTLEEN